MRQEGISNFFRRFFDVCRAVSLLIDAVLDTEGGTYIDDLKAGDLWYFPTGAPVRQGVSSSVG
jgi:hypothetical protein